MYYLLKDTRIVFSLKNIDNFKLKSACKATLEKTCKQRGISYIDDRYCNGSK